MTQLKAKKHTLDSLYNDFDFNGRISSDPIEFPHRYAGREDIEVSAFLASCFAYGKVGLFKGVLEKILNICGKSPYDFAASFEVRKVAPRFKGIKYRFNETSDILCLFSTLSVILRQFGSLRSAFLSCYSEDDNSVLPALSGFIDIIHSIDTEPVYGSNIRPLGYRQFFPSPKGGSACKRLNLFLRWMVRDRDIDFGIWQDMPKHKLIIPLDTHIARISRCIGLSKRSSSDLKTAIEITETLKSFDPEDPLRYDFALCHQGISRLCSPDNCKDCRLKILPE